MSPIQQLTTPRYERELGPLRLSLYACLISLACLLLADLNVQTMHPLNELIRMIEGLLSPSLTDLDELFTALAKTVSYALIAVTIGAVSSFILAPYFVYKLVRVTCTLIRSVHEIFWALIFLQIFGLHPLTGILAISIPYIGILTKIYAEIIEENQCSVALKKNQISRLTFYYYVQLPSAWKTMLNYTRYRFECALRASTVLGFIGLPTIGFYLETSLKEGQYDNVTGILLLLIGLIVSMRWWLNRYLFPCYLAAAFFLVGDWGNLKISDYFFSDIVPSAYHQHGFVGLLEWGCQLFLTSGLTGLANTFILSQVAMMLSGVLALLWYPLVCQHFTNSPGRFVGNILLASIRSLPEYLLAFIFLLLFGPSMLPGIIALGVHNGAIVGQLTGEHANQVTIKIKRLPALERYFYQITPQIYGQLLAFLFYRWEVIIRETAILGILGIHTLGFFVDSGVQALHFDNALFFILLTAMLNCGVDALSSWVRKKVRRDAVLSLAPRV